VPENVQPDDCERVKNLVPAKDSEQQASRGLVLAELRNPSSVSAIGLPERGYDVAMPMTQVPASRASVARQETLAILTSLLSGERRWGDLAGSEIAALERLPQLRALLDAGFAQRHRDPQATLRFARLARYAADRLRPSEFGQEAVSDLRALAWAELGNAYRICDDLPHSAQAMDRAVYWSSRGSQSTLLLARVADLLASLLGSQRRCAEACQLLVMVYAVHEQAGRLHLAGRALFSAANMAAWDGEPEQAIRLMHRAMALLDPDRDPALSAQAVQAIISFLVDLGRFRAARKLLWRSRHRIVESAESLDLVRLRWLEGRIYAGLGDSSRAATAFEETRAGFSEQGQVYGAATAGLDLAALWAKEGRYSEIHALAAEMIATFRAVRVAREAIVTLLILQKACAKGQGQILEIIDMVGSFLKDLERQPPKRSEMSSRR
jgi:hypothetical protein